MFAKVFASICASTNSSRKICSFPSLSIIYSKILFSNHPHQNHHYYSYHHPQLIIEKFGLFNKFQSTIVSKEIYLCQISRSLSTYQKMYSWDNLPTPNVIFVLGGPGAGKGTQCKQICEEFGYVHLSAGDLLRQEQNTPGSQYGTLIDEHIRNGTIVPVEITCSLLENAMLQHMVSMASAVGDEPIPAGNFLIDGFPRNQNNLDGWKKQVDDKVNVKFVLFLECPKEICVQRCLSRGQHSGRADDNPESMNKRLDTYLNQTMPIVEHYEKLNYVKRVDASQDVETVFNNIRKLFA